MRLFHRILVPHDFSENATAALLVAVHLARRTRGRLEVLHALTPFYSGPAYPTPNEIAWTPPRTILADLRKRLTLLVAAALPARGCPPVTVRVVRGDALAAILAAARRSDAIVMATRGRTGLAHLVIGSVAEKVVRHSPIPVLTIRPESARRRRGRSPKTHRRRAGASRRDRRRARTRAP